MAFSMVNNTKMTNSNKNAINNAVNRHIFNFVGFIYDDLILILFCHLH